MKNRILPEWNSYRRAVLHRESPPDQVNDLKNAFYGGAVTIFSVITKISETLSENKATRALEEIHREFGQHADEIRAHAKANLEASSANEIEQRQKGEDWAVTRKLLADARATKILKKGDVVHGDSISYAQGIIDMAYSSGFVDLLNEQRTAIMVTPEMMSVEEGRLTKETVRKIHAYIEEQMGKGDWKTPIVATEKQAHLTGALFDFLGFLTTRHEPLTFSAAHDAQPAVDALRAWAEKRGLDLDSADVKGWQDVQDEQGRPIGMAPVPDSSDPHVEASKRMLSFTQDMAGELSKILPTIDDTELDSAITAIEMQIGEAESSGWVDHAEWKKTNIATRNCLKELADAAREAAKEENSLISRHGWPGILVFIQATSGGQRRKPKALIDTRHPMEPSIKMEDLPRFAVMVKDGEIVSPEGLETVPITGTAEEAEEEFYEVKQDHPVKVMPAGRELTFDEMAKAHGASTGDELTAIAKALGIERDGVGDQELTNLVIYERVRLSTMPIRFQMRMGLHMLWWEIRPIC